jgi:hypothetical protein
MIENGLYYDRLAKKAIEKNIAYILRKMARPGEINEKQIKISRRPKTSVYKGVTYRKIGIKRWHAQHKRKSLGLFLTEDQAHKAYLKYAKKIKK